MEHILRTRFKNEIIAEFLPPKRKSNKVIIICSGVPTVPSKDQLLRFYAKKGYWVFFPRYRGTWESGGEFLKLSPHVDLLDIIEQLPRGFMSAWDRKIYKISKPKVYVLAASFGGPTAILASRNSTIKKVILASPMIDWRYPSVGEPFDWFAHFVQNAFGMAYRGSIGNWRKLKSGNFYNPATSLRKVVGSKMLIFHAKDDKIVSHIPLLDFVKKTDAKIQLYKKGGHFGCSDFMSPKFYREIKKII